jgi:TPR repeat protein
MVAKESLEAPPREEQRGHLAVLYSSNEDAKWVWMGGHISSDKALEDAQDELTRLLEKDAIACAAPDESLSLTDPHRCIEGEGTFETGARGREFELLARAENGDPAAMYTYANSLGSKDAYKWYCRSACGGNAQSKFVMGSYYQSGRQPVSKDLVNAYLWYSQGADDPSTQSGEARQELIHLMTPAQIAEAERLAAEWQPNPAECEAYDVAVE